MLRNVFVVILLLCSTSAFCSAAQVPPDTITGVALQGANTFAFKVGDVRVISLSDGSVPQDAHKLLLGANAQQIDAYLHQAFVTNPVEASINAFFFRLGDHFVLVDTGSGDMFGHGFGGKLLESLALAGVRPDQITDILLTHMHDDHMGGLVHDGQIVFPNATVHVSKIDLDFFLDRKNAAKAHYDISYFDQAEKAITPYLDAGKVQTFETHTEVLPGVLASVHPGHTPGSAFYTLQSQGQSIMFVGDLVHMLAVQLPDPGVTIVYDVDPANAAQARQQAFAAFAHDRTLIAIPHIPFPGVGHLRAVKAGYEWIPVNYGNRDTALQSDFESRHSKSQTR